MLDKDIVDLINREIDGRTSSEESNRLDAILRSDESARQLYDDLRQMTQAMSEVKAVEPPKTLKPAIMRALEAGSAETRRPAVHSRRVPGSFGPLGTWRFILTFAGGVAAGVILFIAIANPNRTDQFPDSDLTGTIARQAFPSSLSAGEKLHVQDELIEGSVESRWGSGICLIHVDLQARGESTIAIQFDPAAVRIAAVRPADRSQTSVVLREGEIIVTGELSQPLDVVFSARNELMPPVQIQIAAGGKTAVSSSMRLQPIGS